MIKRGRSCLCVMMLVLLAAALCPGDVSEQARSHYNSGLAAKRAGDLSAAHRELLMAVKLEPEWAEARWVVAWVYVGLDEKQAAIEQFNWVTYLVPGTEKAEEAEAAIARLGGEVRAPVGARAPKPTLPHPEVAPVPTPVTPPPELPPKPAEEQPAEFVEVPHHPQGIAWHETWEEALAAAGQSGKVIMASVYKPGAPAARQFAETTLAAPQVVEAANQLECVRLRMDEPLPWPIEPQEPEEPQIEGMPKPQKKELANAVLFARPTTGEPFYVTFGLLNAEQFRYYISQAQSFWQMEQQVPHWEQQYAARPDDLELSFRLGRWYMYRGGADIRQLFMAFGGPPGIVSPPEAAQPPEQEEKPPAPGLMGGMLRQGLGPAGAGGKELAGGAWVGIETDKSKAAELREKGALLLASVRRNDPEDELGHANDIDLLLMENALVNAQVDLASDLAVDYVRDYPRSDGVALAYVIQAMGALEQAQAREGAPDFTKAKELLDRALAGPGDQGSKLLAGLFRIVIEFIEGFVKAFEQMGEAMEQGMQ